jgi:hypothetical protein
MSQVIDRSIIEIKIKHCNRLYILHELRKGNVCCFLFSNDGWVDKMTLSFVECMLQTIGT